MTNTSRRPVKPAIPRGFRSRLSSPSGQIIVVFAGGLVAFFMVAGLVIDGGTAFLNRRDAQNTADIAAMAGTKRLADLRRGIGSNDIRATIAKSVAANSCTTACTWTASYVGHGSGANLVDLGPVGDAPPPGLAVGTKVSVTRRPDTYFFRLLGQAKWRIDAIATAVSGDPSGAPAEALMPIGLVDPPVLRTGMIYAFTNGKDAPGNFAWLTWSSGSLSDGICSPDNPALPLLSDVAADPGKSTSSAVRACLDDLVKGEQPVLVPIVEVVDPTAEHLRYRISKLAAVTITGFSLGTVVDQINGRFEGTLPYSKGTTAPGGNRLPPSPDSPFYYIGLVQ